MVCSCGLLWDAPVGSCGVLLWAPVRCSIAPAGQWVAFMSEWQGLSVSCSVVGIECNTTHWEITSYLLICATWLESKVDWCVANDADAILCAGQPHGRQTIILIFSSNETLTSIVQKHQPRIPVHKACRPSQRPSKLLQMNPLFGTEPSPECMYGWSDDEDLKPVSVRKTLGSREKH